MRRITQSVILGMSLGLAVSAQASSMQNLAKLVKEKKYHKAYVAAGKMQARREGEVKFDLLYGIAAVRAGHPNRAAFALERVLAAEPHNARARLEYALSQLMLKNYAAAKVEFNRVLAQNPPKNVQANISQFLAQIKLAEKRGHKHSGRYLAAYVNLGGGYDSNANSSTSESVINLPVLGPIALNPNSQAMSSIFGQLKAGLNGQVPVSRHLDVFGSIAGNVRRNNSASKFNTSSGTLVAGGNFHMGRFQVVLPIMVQALKLNGHRYRNTVFYALRGLYRLNQKTRIGAFIERSRFLYPSTITVNGVRSQDSNLTSIGPIFEHHFSRIGMDLSLRVYAGRETNRANGAERIGRRVLGTDDSIRITKSKHYQPYFGIQYQRSQYKGPVPGFVVDRADHNLSLYTGVKIKLNRDWTFEPSYTFVHNTSNTALYKYNRNQFMLSLVYNTRLL